MLTFVGGEFWIQNNELLTDISSLSSLNNVGENMGVIYNSSLSSLSGLDNIYPESVFNLSIHNNPLLASCDIESICDYLMNPAGIVEIYDNAIGCNSIEEVEENCYVIPSVENSTFTNDFILSPNPVSGSVNLQFEISEQGKVSCGLFDISIVMVKPIINEEKIPGTYQMKIALSDLKPVIYFCILKTSERIRISKIIKL